MSKDVDKITVYIDFKSPYAYLAIEPTRKLFNSLNIKINWVPYVLDIPEYLGSAKVDNSGKVVENNRNEHQWRRVRYSYMDCRRYANIRNMTILGPRKIWDTRMISTTLLWVKKNNFSLLNEFIDHVYKSFWERNLDIENISIIQKVLEKMQITSKGLEEWLSNEGKKNLELVISEAHNKGVFGVPFYIFKEELFWGREQLPMIKARITELYQDII